MKKKFSANAFSKLAFLCLMVIFALPYGVAKNNENSKTSEKSYSAIIMEADSAYSAFNYDFAIARYEAAQKDPAASCDLYLKLADAYFYGAYVKPENEQEALYLKAEKTLRHALTIDSTNAGIYARLGQVTGQLALFRGGKEKVKLGLKIKSLADSALALDPKNPIGNAVLGIWHYQLADLSFFEKFFGKVFFGGIPEGSYDTSAVYLKKAVELAPQMTYYRYYYAKALIEIDQRKEAQKQLETALSQPPLVLADKKNEKQLRELLEDIKD
ncbi:conserved hypothetical protein [Chloroherpeton thalassium ATCC 35110]|uniref:Regulator of microtubule dynamics protein 1 n=1 Tax=Chloroherpeton thalassium (strain ATCC 35110 / GB-78) TaxID=517418 RepID=B3QUR0_CHLT3|nr:tetratricopeptide repeat protein [Chloroherpeton thalassium]ACF12966.1 conserved hypothetical protein [Chloroherpeton thalassium ATCC 35110]